MTGDRSKAGPGVMGMGDAPRKGGARVGSPGDRCALRAVLHVLVVCAAVGSAVAGTAAGPTRGGSVLPTRSASEGRLPPPATENPSWSGELAWATKSGATAFDQVAGAWVQPSVAPSSGAQYADTWVGVDGYDGKLLQIGTTAWTRNGTVSYEAWFVAWTGAPSGMTVIDEPVAAGDHMKAAIDRVASGEWSAVLDDETAGWTWSTTVTYPADGSTAEWIEEAPGTWTTTSHHQTLADYGSVTFTTVRADGAAPATPTPFDITENGAVVSYPSTYDTPQGSFIVRYGEPVPSLHSLSPTSGPASGGSIVHLSGADLGSSPLVRFGDVTAAVVHSSTTSIVVRAPAHLPGEVPVTVTVDPPGSAVGVSAATAATAATGFEYQSVYGYAVVLASGTVHAFGSARSAPRAALRRAAVVGLAEDAGTGGYWETTSAGAVYDDDAPDLGTLATVDRSTGSVTGIVATPTGSGYWLVTSVGAVYHFGSASSFGTLRASHLASRIVGMSASPTGRGYWLVASNGRVYPFGTASHLGSAADLPLGAAAFVGMSATPTGKGYWLVTSDGRVFAFGKARDFGSVAAEQLHASIVGIAASGTGKGYWLVAADGRVFSFGAARFLGSLAPSTQTPRTVGIVGS